MKKELLALIMLGSFAIVGCQKDEATAPEAQLSADKLSAKDVLGEKDLAGTDSTEASYIIEVSRIAAPVESTESAKKEKAEKAKKEKKEKDNSK